MILNFVNHSLSNVSRDIQKAIVLVLIRIWKEVSFCAVLNYLYVLFSCCSTPLTVNLLIVNIFFFFCFVCDFFSNHLIELCASKVFILCAVEPQ